MAETNQIGFAYQEIATILVKHQEIHEGHWGVVFEFNVGGGLIPAAPNSTKMVPGIIVPISKIALQKFDEPNLMTIDASKVNPISNN
jgi:hypothetical protein